MRKRAKLVAFGIAVVSLVALYAMDALAVGIRSGMFLD